MDEKEPLTIVLFRKGRRKEPDPDAEVTAVFPEIPWGGPEEMTCYVRVGQHGACSFAWYDTTRRAKPAEYRELALELQRIGYRLDIRVRITKAAHRNRRAAWRATAA